MAAVTDTRESLAVCTLDSSLLRLPEEILSEILVQCGPRSSTKLAQTCRSLMDIHRSNSTWKRFLEVYEYSEYAEVPASQARETALQHYCRSCDSIKSGIQMFYTGSVCIACEYRNPDNQRHFYCQSRFNRFRLGQRPM